MYRPREIQKDIHNHQSRIRTIGKTILENYSKWQATELRERELRNQDHRSLYPYETFCDKLKLITTIFEDILESTTEAHRQVDIIIQCQYDSANKEKEMLWIWDLHN